MFGSLTFSSLASSLTELSSKVSSTVTSTATDLTSSISSSVTHFVEDTKRSFDEEQSKIDSRRAQLASLSSRPPPSPLWHVASESQQILEAELRQRILRLSADPRTFLSPAPDDGTFAFSLEVAWPYAEVALREDAGLGKARYRLVPRRVSEHQFWKNYMYRVAAIREQMGVAELFETTQKEADDDREKLRQERLKKKEDDAKKEKQQQQQKPAAALPLAAPVPSPPPALAQPEERKVKAGAPPTAAPSSPPPPPAAAASPSPPRPAPAPRARRDSDDAEFISDDYFYVNVASQDVALVGAMRRELGIQGGGGNAPVAGMQAALVVDVDSDGKEGLEGVTDADLDDLENMLADIEVNEGEAREDLLDELDAMDDHKKSLP